MADLDALVAVVASGAMPRTAMVRPMTEAVSHACGALERALPLALAAAARLRRCVTHDAAIAQHATSGKPTAGALDAKVGALTFECHELVERLNAAGHIAAEWGAFSAWAGDLGRVLAQGHGEFDEQRDGLVERLRHLRNLPTRLLNKLDEVDPPEREDDLGYSFGSSAELNQGRGGIMANRSVFETKLLSGTTWGAPRDGRAAAGGLGRGNEGGRGEAATVLSPTRTVELLDEVVSAAVMGAGPLRLDLEQLTFCRAQLEALNATAHVMAGVEGACVPLRAKLSAVVEGCRDVRAALASLGPQLRAAARRRSRASGGVAAALAAAAQGKDSCGAVWHVAWGRLRRRLRHYNARALTITTVALLAALATTAGIIVIVYGIAAGQGVSGGAVALGIAILGAAGGLMTMTCVALMCCGGSGGVQSYDENDNQDVPRGEKEPLQDVEAGHGGKAKDLAVAGVTGVWPGSREDGGGGDGGDKLGLDAWSPCNGTSGGDGDNAPMLRVGNAEVMVIKGHDEQPQQREEQPHQAQQHEQQYSDPTEDEMLSYARHLGIDPSAEPDLVWIAEQAYCAPAPEHWEEYVDEVGNIYYFNTLTGISSWTHPLEDQFRALVMRCRADKDRAAMAREAEDSRTGLAGIQETAALPQSLTDVDREEEEEDGSNYEDYKDGEFGSFELSRSKGTAQDLSFTQGTSGKGLSLRARRLRDLSGSGADIGFGGHSGRGGPGLSGRALLRVASDRAVASVTVTPGRGGVAAQPPVPDEPPPRDVPGVAVPPSLKEAEAAAAGDLGTPYGSLRFNTRGDDDDDDDIALGASTRYKAGGGDGGSVGRDCGWGLSVGVVASSARGAQEEAADEAYDSFGGGDGGSISRDYSHYGSAARGGVGPSQDGGGKKSSDLNISSGRGGALAALFNSLPNHAPAQDDG